MGTTAEEQGGASIRVVPGKGVLTIAVSGRLDAESAAPIREPAVAAIADHPSPLLVLDASGLEHCDVDGMGLIVDLWARQKERGGGFEIRGISPELEPLLAQIPEGEFELRPAKRRGVHPAEEIGYLTVLVLRDVRRQVEFIGELSAEIFGAIVRRQIRWKDLLRLIETTGVNAVPIMALVGFLIGVILAFSSAMGLKPYGAEIYAADLLAFATVRELGPILTAIVLAGRSGSAFAAEIGTMKVNEELDALTTMGIPPIRFLVVPRVLATVLVTPLLTMFTNLLALVGGAVVILSVGFPLVTYVEHVQGMIGLTDVAIGLVKSLVFALIVAAIGCLRGLQTGDGALAVGASTTRSVVAGIVLIIGTDGIFAVILYLLNL